MQTLWQKYWIGFALILIIPFVLWQSQAGIVDDAYITYRYSANLLNGNGLVYNPGEWILGTTTPSFAITLATLSAPFGSQAIPTTALIINGIAFTISLILIMLIIVQLTGKRYLAMMAMLLVMTAQSGVVIIGAGMETSLLILCIVAAHFFLLKDRALIGAIFAGLAVLVRPEGAFVVGIYGLTMMGILWQDYHDSLIRWFRKLIPYGILLTLPGIIYAILTTIGYGSPIPHSIVAKAGGTYPIGIETAIINTLAVFGNLFISVFDLIDFTIPDALYPLSAIFMLMFAVAGMVWVIRQDQRLWGIPAFVIIVTVFYSLSNTRLFLWYISNFAPFMILLMWAGIYRLLEIIAGGLKNDVGQRIVYGTGVVIFALYLGANLRVAISPPDNAYPTTYAHLQSYFDVTDEIEDRIPEGTTIAMIEIGVLGYELPEMYVLDAAGLVSEQTIPHLPVPESQRYSPFNAAIPPTLIQEEEPDMVILIEIFGRYGILDDEWFRNNYTEVMHREVDPVLDWADGGLLVFSHNDFAEGMALLEQNNTQ